MDNGTTARVVAGETPEVRSYGMTYTHTSRIFMYSCITVFSFFGVHQLTDPDPKYAHASPGPSFGANDTNS